MKFSFAPKTLLVTLLLQHGASWTALADEADAADVVSLRGAASAEGAGNETASLSFRRRLGGYEDSCDAGRPCDYGLSCHPGIHKCYNSPRQLYEPCVAGHGCESGYSCQAFAHVCVHEKRLPYEACDVYSDAFANTCIDGTYCDNPSGSALQKAFAVLKSISDIVKLLKFIATGNPVGLVTSAIIREIVGQFGKVCIPESGKMLAHTVSGGPDDGLQVFCNAYSECRATSGCSALTTQDDCEFYSGCVWSSNSCGGGEIFSMENSIVFEFNANCNEEGGVYKYKVDLPEGYRSIRELSLQGPTILSSNSVLPPATQRVRSIKFRGPMKRGTWIQISDSRSFFAASNTINIVVQKNLASGEHFCVHVPGSRDVPSVGQSVANSSYRWRYTREGSSKVTSSMSKFMLNVPADNGDINVNALRNLQWTPKFSEEDGGYSPGWGAPVVAMSNSNNWGDEKWLLQARGSTCRQSGQQITSWTSWMTSSDGSHQRRDCPNGHVVGRMQCSGGNCRHMRLGCFQVSHKCAVSTSGFVAVRVNEAREGFCPDLHVVTGLRCYRDRCKNHELICRRLTRADA